MNPLDGTEMVLISKEPSAPYSGMLPSRLAGWYPTEDMEFNLPALCAQNQVTFICATVTGLDATAQTVSMAERPPLNYDVASINVGITPELPPGAVGHAHVTAVKPIGDLLGKWRRLLDKKVKRLVIVGGGAAGFELAVICRLQFPAGEICLMHSGETLLSGYSRRAQGRATRILREAGVQILLGRRVREVRGQILLSDGGDVAFDEAIFTTGAVGPAWLHALNTNKNGFVVVDRYLQVQPRVFAAGDCAHFAPSPLPKSGVYAVRQGPLLSTNLRRTLQGKPLRTYRPQKRALALLTAGERRALLTYGPLVFEGEWVWKWKNSIDRRFMERFGARPAKPMASPENTCGGCGGKVAAADVWALIAELNKQKIFRSLLPAGTEDIGQVGSVATTIDGFRTFSSDLFFFAQVAVWHALNDLFASGLAPLGLNAYVSLPPAGPRVRQSQLLNMMSGVLEVLRVVNAPLLNAHSAEGADAALVLSAVASSSGGWWKKGGMKSGDALILTKALGTGTYLQAEMAGALSVHQWKILRRQLLQHHAGLVPLLEHVHACTDVSGFGLLGHLTEMIEASKATVELELARIPVLPGFAELQTQGFQTHLGGQNQATFEGAGPAVLWDPQTHGPLLISVPTETATRVLALLAGAGFTSCARIGTVVSLGSAAIRFK